jgi:endothelin-converting enzyme/putative endopeptidase
MDKRQAPRSQEHQQQDEPGATSRTRSSIDWDAYLKAVHAPASDHFIVTSPDFFRAEEKLITSHPLDHWQTYRWQVIHRSAPYLTKAIVDENFDFFSRTLAGAEEQRPRWRRCVAASDRDLGDALGQAYVDRAFSPESKARTIQMVHAIETALSSDIQSLNWMSPATRQQAMVKLKGIEDKIHPSRWHEYSSVKIGRDSYLNNVAQATSFEFERWVAKIGKPVDRAEWTMTPPTINAYYDPQLNTINFPAGILQPPYFDPTKDDAVNYGAIGMVIGHEIIHGFDDQGRKFDDKGNLRDWWTADDAKKYDERGKCISDEYTQDVPDAGAGVKQNGLLTQGEDTADNGGNRLALAALEIVLKEQGVTRRQSEMMVDLPPALLPLERVFLVRECPSANRAPDRHSLISLLPEFRINNVISNMPEFGQGLRLQDRQKWSEPTPAGSGNLAD